MTEDDPASRNKSSGGSLDPGRSGECVYGVRPVVETLRSGRREIFEVLDASENREVAKLASARNIRVRGVSRGDLDELTGGVHQGLVARVGNYPYSSLDEILARPDALVVVLDEVTDPQNLGAILRVAEGAGASGVVIPKDRSAQVNETVVRASAGASEHVRVAKVTNLRRALDEMKNRGVWTFAAEAEGSEAGRPGANSTLYSELDLTGPVALVFGSEGRGVRRLVRDSCDGGVYLPMAGEVSSLNVSAAAAVLLYEARRQRGTRA